MFTRERLAEIRENIKEKNQDCLQAHLPDVRVINIVLKAGNERDAPVCL
jgi:cyclin-C